MPPVRNALRDPVYGLCKARDVRSDMPVSPCDYFRELSVVIGDDQSQSVELPGDPYGLSFCPFDKILGLFGLGQRERGELVSLLLPFCRIRGDPVRGAFGKHGSRLRFHLFQAVEQSVPLEVAHYLAFSVVVSVARLVELRDDGPHFVELELVHHIKQIVHSFSSSCSWLPPEGRAFRIRM